MSDRLNATVASINAVLFSDVTIYALLTAGLLFTIWTKVGQYRALTHGVAVLRGQYDRADHPGAINHFQALSAALSATVGLGNIGGVAIAVSLGGPGAVLWMWIIGLLGMALKMTEVTQAMLYRNLDDPSNPHGGPMFVAREGFRQLGLPWLGRVVGAAFVASVLVGAITGGNMFQAWNVADVTQRYFGVSEVVTGVVMATIVGLVIVGGIRRIGAFAARIVPFMCLSYLAAASYVLLQHLGELPRLFVLILRAGLPVALGGTNVAPEGAFLGASVGYAAMWGIKRALYSSEVGQGSAPIAHSAAKTDEPVREGVVAGLEPFVDTLVVCTMTALVILATGAHARGPEAFCDREAVRVTMGGSVEQPSGWRIETPSLAPKTPEARRILRAAEGSSGWTEGAPVFLLARASGSEPRPQRLPGKVVGNEEQGWRVNWEAVQGGEPPVLVTEDDRVGIYGDYTGASLTAHAFDRALPGLGMWLVVLASWLFALSTIISWSYYGEQGIEYLLGARFALPYRLLYCAATVFATLGFIKTDTELDAWTTLGTGVMLVVNLPLMLVFAAPAMRAYHTYVRRLRTGAFEPRPPRAAASTPPHP